MIALSLVAVLVILGAAGARPAAAPGGAPSERPAPPRTAWGAPDLQGLWNYGTSTPLERPARHAGRVRLTEEEVAAADRESQSFATSERRSELSPLFDLSLAVNQVWWDLGLSTGRTSLVTAPADGRLPPRTASRQAYEATGEAQRLQAARWGLGPARGPEDMAPNDRCLVDAQVPVTPGSDNNHVRILQTPGQVVILHEKIHDWRIIPLAPRSGSPVRLRQWLGVSRGRWEGDALVVETTSFRADAEHLGSGAGRHVVERFTRRGAGTLDYSFTVTDPSVWTGSWTASVPWRQAEGPSFEYACHEGNYSMTNLLAASRALDAAVDAAGGTGPVRPPSARHGGNARQ